MSTQPADPSYLNHNSSVKSLVKSQDVEAGTVKYEPPPTAVENLPLKFVTDEVLDGLPTVLIVKFLLEMSCHADDVAFRMKTVEAANGSPLTGVAASFRAANIRAYTPAPRCHTSSCRPRRT